MDPSATPSQSTTDSALPPNLFVILCEGLVLSKGGVQPSFWSQECVWIYVNFFCFYVILLKKKTYLAAIYPFIQVLVAACGIQLPDQGLTQVLCIGSVES